jgi:hypothetical protein
MSEWRVIDSRKCFQEGGLRMNGLTKYIPISIVLSIIIMVGSKTESYAQSTNGSPPVINFAWAQEKIRQGEDWRIYFSATDADGDMTNIYCKVNQPGGNIYRPDTTRVKKEWGGKLTGYLVLRTNSPVDLYGVNLTLTLTIEDRAKNESKPVTFELNFDGERMKPLPADRVSPDLAKELNQRIGYIGIDLMRRDRMGGGD